ncbi:MAG: 4'-phosphopantetheinyl transferase superfamily protein [Lachnospiraceae bacterium]|nr:4'-phosphopantetheinyl transferase superfamily protein [Lachnospiraceae bacterium]
MLYITSFSTTEKSHDREHAAGKLLLSCAVKEEYGFPVLPEIDKREYGKPYFPEYENVHFNISHTGNMAVCALGETELGVDIERIRPVKEAMQNRVLTEREREWLLQKSDMAEAFIRLWTLKESYIKATGQGLRTELSSIEFTIRETSEGEEIVCSREGFYFWQKKIGSTSYLALCMQGKKIPQEMKKLHIVFL